MPDSDEAEIIRLAELTPIQYEQERGAAAKQLGCRASILDRLVEEAAQKRAKVPQESGQTPIAPDIDPWPSPVDGAALLDALAETIRLHVALEDTEADAVALWIMHTHALDAAYVSPRLAITSPEKRCGKTTLLTLLKALVAKPLATANVTASVLFRTVDALHPTLLIDEADTFIGGAETIRGIIDAGHSRGTAQVLRSVPDTRDDWKPRSFNVWGAMGIAMIGRPPGTIEDRSISIALRRKRPNEQVARLRIDRLDQFAPLARKAARWAIDHLASLKETDPDVPAELHDRAADNWRPLFAIANTAGGAWPKRAQLAAVVLTGRNTSDTGALGTLLLADLRELFAAAQGGVLFTSEIVLALRDREDRPWGEYHRGQPITPYQLAALLKPFGIPTNQTVRRGERTAKGYRAKDFVDTWARYLSPPGAVTRSQAADSAASGEGESVTPGRNVTDKS